MAAYFFLFTALLPTLISAHGAVINVMADGVNHPADSANSVTWKTKQHYTVDWTVNPDHYQHPDIVCHIAATPAQNSLSIKPGTNITLTWSEDFPGFGTHPGPILHYIAKCDGDCKDANKTTLKWVKFQQWGVTTTNGYMRWATDDMVSADRTWTFRLPNFAPGNYVLRHEAINIYRADHKNGAENYPNCINLKITGNGTQQVTGGVLATALYTDSEPGILYNFLTARGPYTMPGPNMTTFKSV